MTQSFQTVLEIDPSDIETCTRNLPALVSITRADPALDPDCWIFTSADPDAIRIIRNRHASIDLDRMLRTEEKK